MEPDRLVESVRSKIDAVRSSQHREAVIIGRNWWPEPSHALFGIIMAVSAFGRMAGRDQDDKDRHVVHTLGMPGLKYNEAVDKAQADRLIKLYPRDPRVRLAYAEKLVDDNRIAEAASVLRALHTDDEALDAFHRESPRLKGELMAVMAEALMKRNRKGDAHDVVGPVCQDLDDRVFAKMRELDLCHYSWERRSAL